MSDAGRRILTPQGVSHPGVIGSPTALTTADDPNLSDRIRQRDHEALEAVVRAYLAQVVRAARGAGFTAPQAEELAQETFATFVETAPRFEGRSHVRTWLLGILYRKMAEARRALGRDRQTDDLDAVMESRFDARGRWRQPPRAADDLVYAEQVRRGIVECLDEAPLAQRTAVVLREVEELPTPEICKILEVSSTNLGVMMYRVRNRLRLCLEARGIGRSDGC